MKAIRQLGVVALCASITVVVSERFFWFWSPGLEEHLTLVAFYSIPIVAVLWTIGHYRVNSLWSLLLVTPIYAYLIEGLITPVMYTGGPLVPFFPAWFAMWHGVLAVFVALILFRRWLLAGAMRALAAASASLGLFWGVWSSTLRLPESVEDAEVVADIGALTVLDPGQFALYAGTFTLVFAVSHLLLGFVWRDRFTLSRWTRRVGAGFVLLGVTAWTFVVPWALPMFIGYVGLQRWGLKRHAARATGPDLHAQLVGRVQLRSLAPTLLIAPFAAGSYAAIWSIDPSDSALRWVMYTTIGLQACLGAYVTVRALIRSGRTDDRTVNPPAASPTVAVGQVQPPPQTARAGAGQPPQHDRRRSSPSTWAFDQSTTCGLTE